MPNKQKAKSPTPTRASRSPRAAHASSAFQLHPVHSEKIAALKPRLLEAVHDLLKSNGVDAVVHTISFRPAAAVAMGSGPCGSMPCCYINGVWTCPG
jgi:hypothetical protein